MVKVRVGETSMDELITDIIKAAGIGPDAARLAIGTVLNFIRDEAP